MGVWIFKCKSCRDQIKFPNILQDHLLKHWGFGKSCGHENKIRNKLHIHVYEHGNNFFDNCKNCGKGFIFGNHVKAHEQKH